MGDKKPKVPEELLWKELHADLLDSLQMAMSIDPVPTSPERQLLEDLASAVERYEKVKYRIYIERLKRTGIK